MSAVAGPDHEEFLGRLYGSKLVELWLGYGFLEKGFTVKTGKLEAAVTPWEGSRFKEQCDLVVNGQILEVKAVRTEFTSPADFPYQTVFTCRVNRWESYPEKPLAFLTVSKPTGAVIVTPCQSFDSWKRVSTIDRARGWEYEVYEAPKSALCTLPELDAFLERVKPDAT